MVHSNLMTKAQLAEILKEQTPEMIVELKELVGSMYGLVTCSHQVNGVRHMVRDTGAELPRSVDRCGCYKRYQATWEKWNQILHL